MRVLIVDDSMFVRRIVSNHLIKAFEDIEIIQSDNGSTAFDEYCKQDIDFIITDLLMPVMTGQELIGKIHALDKPYNCIVCTADIQEGTREDLKVFDIKEIISKPLTPDKLELVSNYLKEFVNE